MTKPILANLALWLFAILVTIWMTEGTPIITRLTPLLVICMMGSTIILKNALDDK